MKTVRIRSKFAHYHSVSYWEVKGERGGIMARFRAQYSECLQWFPSLARFKRAAAAQFAAGEAHKTSAEADAVYSMLTYS